MWYAHQVRKRRKKRLAKQGFDSRAIAILKGSHPLLMDMMMNKNAKANASFLEHLVADVKPEELQGAVNRRRTQMIQKSAGRMVNALHTTRAKKRRNTRVDQGFKGAAKKALGKKQLDQYHQKI